MRWLVRLLAVAVVLVFGAGLLAPLALYVATVVGGLAIQQVVTYGLALKLLASRSPFEFFRQCREVLLYAFSTASSNASSRAERARCAWWRRM